MNKSTNQCPSDLLPLPLKSEAAAKTNYLNEICSARVRNASQTPTRRVCVCGVDVFPVSIFWNAPWTVLLSCWQDRQGLVGRSDGFTAMSPTKGLVSFQKICSESPQPESEQNSFFASVAGRPALLSIRPRGHHTSHLPGGAAIGYMSLDNVVFVGNSRRKGRPHSERCVFLRVKQGPICLM